MEYTIYVDAMLLIAAFLVAMHALILWAVSQILHLRTSGKRIFVASLVGTATDCGILFADLAAQGAPAMRAAEGLMTLLTLAVSAKVAYPGTPRRIMIKAIAHTYLLTIVSAGSSLAAYYMSGENPWVARITGAASLVITMEAGWSLIQGRFAPDDLRVRMEIAMGGREVAVTALIDTGHSLRDPLSRAPVAIVELACLGDLIPGDVKQLFAGSEPAGLTALASIDSGSQWASRIRIIPYTSLGRADGMLMGFRPDFVRLVKGGKETLLSDVIIGVHDNPLSRESDFGALIPPEMLQQTDSA